jgi:nucleoid-associated protein YgaU
VFDSSDQEAGMSVIRTNLQQTAGAPVPNVAASPQGIRLTRRGRLVLLVLLAAALVALLGVTRTAVAWAEPTGPTTRTVVVQAGDSLWEIARTVDPQRDPRAVIAEIEDLNGLNDAPVVAGQALIVPT